MRAEGTLRRRAGQFNRVVASRDAGGAPPHTPPDGSRPRMQMYLWSAPTPDRDGDFDNGIIIHEYGHGISNRLVGGPSNTSCLTNRQQPGEGLSDWWALVYTAKPGDRGTEVDVSLDYDAPGGKAGTMIAKLFGEEPLQQIRDDLRRFKQVMETGEVVLSDGSLEGAGEGAMKERAARAPGLETRS